MPGHEPGGRSALIIASGQYLDDGLMTLQAPSQDAAELAEVLGDQAIGGFDLQILLDKPDQLVREEVDGFFADRRVEDTLVLYLSCHGVKDPGGRLYFAASTTKLHRLASTAISADFVYEQVDRCRARRILLLLDCCYSGAYLKGHRPRGQNRAGVKPLEGRGRAVITSCTALEQAFELDTGQVSGAAVPSVFTTALVEGLRTGKADRDGDGLVSVDELYTYLSDRIREITPHQTPEKKWEETRGDFYIARNPCPPARPEPPPPNAGAGSHARKSPTTRRVFLGMAGLSTAGLAVTGWELARRTPARQRVTHGPARTPAPTKLWSNSIGISIKAVRENVVYVSINDGLAALHASTGKTLWRSTFKSSKHLHFLTLSEDGIIFAGDPGQLYALDANDGHELWRHPIAYLTGPAVTKGVVYVADEYGTIYALRSSDGSTLWNYKTAQGEPSSDLAASGDIVYTAGANYVASIYALRAGSELWRSPIAHVLAGPRVAENSVYVIGAVGAPSNLQLHALSGHDGAIRWSFTKPTGSFAPLVNTDALYVQGYNSSYALNTRSGSIRWKLPFRARPCQLSEKIVCLAGEQEAYAVRISDGTKVWNFPAPNGIRNLISASDTVYLASNNLYALRASNGAVLWSYPVAADSVTPNDDGTVYLAGSGEILALHR